MERNRTFKKIINPDLLELGLSYDDVLIRPKFSEFKSRSEADVTSRLTRNIDIDVPIVSSNMDTVTEVNMARAMALAGGVGVVHRNMPVDEQAAQVSELSHLKVGAAVGVSEHYLSRAEKLIEVGVDFLVLDIAHGHAEHALQALVDLKKRFEIDVVAGNVATGYGFRDLAEAGADAIKVGIGPGAACTTRIVAGVGVPQLTALIECAPVSQEYNIPMIADGGIKNPGDVSKAIAAGADTVMIGSMLAGCDESPGEEFEMQGQKWKTYRGMASREAQAFKVDRVEGRSFSEDTYETLYAEGVTGQVPATGPVNWTITKLTNGLRSAMSYVGANTIDEYRSKVDFIRVTSAGMIESDHRLTNASPVN